MHFTSGRVAQEAYASFAPSEPCLQLSKHTAQAICVLPVQLLMAEIVDQLKVFVRLCSTFIFRDDVMFMDFFPIE